MPEAVARVVATAVAYGAGVAGFDGSTWRLTGRYVRLGPAGGYRAPRVAVSAGALTDTSCVTMSVVHEERDVLAALTRDLDGVVGIGLSRVAGLDILDITARSVDKGIGVLRALQVIGADPAAAVSFGDMPNDIPMFAVTGRAYAVGCSHPEVAAAADEVLAPVEHDRSPARSMPSPRRIGGSYELTGSLSRCVGIRGGGQWASRAVRGAVRTRTSRRQARGRRLEQRDPALARGRDPPGRARRDCRARALGRARARRHLR